MRLNTRNSIRVEDAFDVVASLLDFPIERFFQNEVAAPHAHGDIKYERKKRQIDLRRDRCDVECDLLLAREVTGERTPGDREVDITDRDRIDDLARRIRLPIV